MNKTILTAVSIILLSNCSTEIIKEPVPVTSHTQMNKLLNDCDRLGQVSIEYETQKDLSRRENMIQAQNDMKQQAYDEYRADNIVFIKTQYVKGAYRVKDMIHGRGIAYKCY